ncbi:DNA polymerase III subunit beta [Roseibacillus ishigakijimensis]|uniref:Beta sliding clamp n=1 Tax=Roseibacillus ishigakijimensis TaxID=454146 RepID=A0A934RNT2_9BACT|nr:DNA polymerase III subunit beta [Roseibacillus ishigakijimensis]MBK1832796.1 DNA polymerase III subunit beta [Roseibacillus ishigakijimensis]
MKFRIAKEAFLDGLQQVQHVVSTRTTLPILSNVLIEAKDNQLRLTTTDLDVGVSGTVEAEVLKEGATTLPAKRLLSIIRELPSAEVEIAIDGKNVANITSGPSFFKIIGLSHEEFPPLPDFNDAREYRIPQILFKEGLKKTSYAISSDETRYVLNGIFISFKEGRITLVATDGRRLAMVENDLEFPASHETEIIVPTKAIQELGRLSGLEGEVLVKLQSNQISFQIGDSIIVSKLIEGNYPNYRQVIPGERKERLDLNRESFYETVRRVSLLSSEKSNSVKLVFGPDNLDVTANSPEIGEAKESMPIKYDGPTFAIAFNPDFLMAPLRALEEDELHLDLIDEMSPGVLRAAGNFLYVLMPMRVTN